LANPEAALTRVCQFLQIPVPEIPPGGIRPAPPATGKRWAVGGTKDRASPSPNRDVEA
jgi:hypothetical protein